MITLLHSSLSESEILCLKINMLGIVPHAYKPSTFGRLRTADHLSPGVQDQPGQHNETPYLLKNTKISWAWWHVPVVSATWEADAGESLEPGGQKLQ